MIKEIEKAIKIKEVELQELEEKLEKIKSCHHQWRKVELGEGETGFQCQKCGVLKYGE